MRYFYALLFLLFAASLALADTVTLEWTPNTEPDIGGYEAFMREARAGYNYAEPSWTGKESTCQIQDVSPLKSYHFVVRAFDTEGYRSGNSKEVSYFRGTIPDGIPPGIPGDIIITITISGP